ncbi:MAG: ferredoxin [Actinomycetota bacterium]|nr:ferredoxin [Actinomycetota bacterium]
MRVEIDTSNCSGHGRCYTLAPDIFGYGDDGFGTVLKSEVIGADEIAQARRAEAGCPERAVLLTDPEEG